MSDDADVELPVCCGGFAIAIQRTYELRFPYVGMFCTVTALGKALVALSSGVNRCRKYLHVNHSNPPALGASKLRSQM